MVRKVLLAIIIVGASLAAGVSLAAGAGPLAHLLTATPVFRVASASAEYDGPTMFLVGIGLMAVIARRRYH
jgi:ABC-type enterobactin transport system permease subunit